MSVEDMTPREAYEEGYRNGESNLLADVATLCDHLDIEIGEGQHEFDAIRAEVTLARDALRELWDDIREVDKMFVPNDVVAKVKTALKL